VCATYGWLGSVSADNCVIAAAAGSYPSVFFPPCNWAADAGVAVQGAGAGQTRFALCEALYACIISSGCMNAGTQAASECLCGPGNQHACQTSPAGPCRDQELAALEVAPGDYATALKNLTDHDDPSFPGSNAGMLNQTFAEAITNHCLGGDAGHAP
jgi:hypothetical protein